MSLLAPKIQQASFCGMTAINTTLLASYAKIIHERYEYLSSFHPYTLSKRGEIALYVLDCSHQGYSSKAIIERIQQLRGMALKMGYYTYQDDIDAFMREFRRYVKEEKRRQPTLWEGVKML